MPLCKTNVLLLGTVILGVLSACAASRPPAAPVATPTDQKLVSRPVAPPDLSELLARHAPLRSLLLGESGSATLAITVREDGSVVPGAVRESTGQSFAEGCAQNRSPS